MIGSDDAGSGGILRAVDARTQLYAVQHRRRKRNPADSCGQVRSLGTPLIERRGMPERIAATMTAAGSAAANCIPATAISRWLRHPVSASGRPYDS